MTAYRRGLLLSPLFAELSDPSLDYLVRKARLVTFDAGERVVARGDEIRYAGVVLSGGIRSSITSIEGCEASSSVVRRGSFFGIMGIPEPTKSHWDCAAVAKTELVALYCSDIRASFAHHPEIALLVAKALNYRLKKSFSLISNATLQNLENRVRRTLVMLAGDPRYGGEKPADIAITQEALGNFVQCTRPTINKVLKDLERAGMIEVGYGRIRIVNMRALQAEIEDEAVYYL
ncbi:Crp/Fnr family transcriptional regulator [Oricola sp.]|uniref:Crp/Fnr family transcriptional regulator n=1 Tax=Oricola sp. TaxID=1979950 RepID=UPI0025E28D26|nr:Crp/Fnr family transcriptional regulator [Oricola sp.]MCI5076743.1 Crp/Fnr family transcriptional regulator [Oricola sp.]